MIAEQSLGPNAVDHNLDRFLGECLRGSDVNIVAGEMLVYLVVRMTAFGRAYPNSWVTCVLADLARMAAEYYAGKETDGNENRTGG